MEINVTGYSRQLPTVILFKNFKEVRRFPGIDEQGRIGKVLRYEPKELERFFEFRLIYVQLSAQNNK